MKTVGVDVSSLRRRVTELAEAFCILRGILTKIHMCVQLDDAILGF